MLGFLRRHAGGRHAGGRHGLGAAVTAIPSEPRRVAVPLPARAAVPAPPAAPPEQRPEAPLHPSAHRVELGFRDGTTTVLEPASEHGQALLEIAALLSGRDAPFGSSTRPPRPTPSR